MSKPMLDKGKNERESGDFNTQVHIQGEDSIKIERFNLFECILSADLSQKKYRFNIPETIIMDEEGNYQLLNTDREILTKKIVHKGDILSIF